MSASCETEKRRARSGRPFQFGLKSLLVLVLVSALAFGLVGRQLRLVRAENRAIDELLKVEAYVDFETTEAAWWERLLGEEEIRSAQRVVLYADSVTDEHVAQVAQLRRLQYLYIRAGGVTDAGIAHLADLDNLKVLRLRYLNLSDAALVRLRRLSSLEELELLETDVTEQGVIDLKRARPDLQIDFNGQPISMIQ